MRTPSIPSQTNGTAIPRSSQSVTPTVAKPVTTRAVHVEFERLHIERLALVGEAVGRRGQRRAPEVAAVEVIEAAVTATWRRVPRDRVPEVAARSTTSGPKLVLMRSSVPSAGLKR